MTDTLNPWIEIAYRAMKAELDDEYDFRGGVRSEVVMYANTVAYEAQRLAHDVREERVTTAELHDPLYLSDGELLNAVRTAEDAVLKAIEDDIDGFQVGELV